MSHRLRGLGLLAVSMIACLGLSACQPTETPPKTSPTASTAPASESPTATPTASAEPTPKPATAEGPAENIPVPEMPELARENSRNGAISFAEHYFDVINYSTATTTTNELKKLTTRQCELCATRLIDPIDAADRNGAWQVGGLYEYQMIDLLESGKDSSIAVFNYDSAAQELFIAPNELVRAWSAQTEKVVTFHLTFDDGWKVNKLATAEE